MNVLQATFYTATNINKRLMSSLEKFAKFAQPDKLLMVGEVREPI
jgi:hypothetical protein